MKWRQRLAIMGALALACACPAAAATLHIDVPDVFAYPGGTASWDFHLTNDDPEYFLVVAVGSFETPTPVGVFNDVISTTFYLVSPFETWSGVFGTYTVDPTVLPPASATGQMAILYDLLDADFETVSSGNLLFAVETASITVTETPEPAAAILLLLGLGAILIARRVRCAPVRR